MVSGRRPADPGRGVDFFSSEVGLYTDLYELTMAQGYFLEGLSETEACFDYFFRSCPFEGGYVVFAGLGDLIPLLQKWRFHEDQLDYLRSIGFRRDFTDFLRGLCAEVEVLSVLEGEVVFPFEPVVRVRGPLPTVQLLETLFLNLLNFESLVATKASRLRLAAGERKVVDFGLRRAQGLGGLHASRAAGVGGVDATSNVLAGYRFGLEPSGTQAHSWIQAFGDELTAFRIYARHYPDRCILLVDTYDTLGSGLPNAIRVGRELEVEGHRLAAVRLDSGDLADLSKKARRMLDEAGLRYVKIAASNQLDEWVIRSLLDQGAPIDLFGVGTRLVTGRPDGALDGVYKLSAVDGLPRLKVSESYEKVNFPGSKRIVRFLQNDDRFYADGVVLEEEGEPDRLFHPHQPEKSFEVGGLRAEPILRKVFDRGEPTGDPAHVTSASEYRARRLRQLHEEVLRFENPAVYPVGLGPGLRDLRDRLLEKGGFESSLG